MNKPFLQSGSSKELNKVYKLQMPWNCENYDPLGAYLSRRKTLQKRLGVQEDNEGKTSREDTQVQLNKHTLADNKLSSPEDFTLSTFIFHTSSLQWITGSRQNKGENVDMFCNRVMLLYLGICFGEGQVRSGFFGFLLFLYTPVNCGSWILFDKRHSKSGIPYLL